MYKEKMKNLINRSFKRELIACFFAIALVPLIVASCFLIQIFKATVSRNYEKRITLQMNELEEKIADMCDEFQKTADLISQDDAIIRKINETDSWEKKKVYNRLYEVTKKERDAAFFQIYNDEGCCQYTTSSENQKNDLPVYWGILKVANAHRDQTIIRNVSEYDTSGNVILQLARAIQDEQDNLLGYVVVNMTKEHFDQLLQGNYELQNSVTILDGFWEEVYSTQSAKESSIAELLRNRRLNGESINQKKDEQNLYIRPIENTGLYLIIGREPIFTQQITGIMFWVILLVAFGSLILSMVLADKLSNYMAYPIRKLTRAMKEAENGNLSQQLVVNRNDEFKDLSESFNAMTGKLKENLELQVKHQKELNDANIAMMQAQLNPHFIYNTLDTIKWVAKVNHVPEVAKLSSSLAKILRFSISSNKFIPLSEEIKMVEYYIYIQKTRFDGYFSFDMEIPLELEDCIVPKLIIQPIVENSIIHGLANQKDGHIFLNATENDGVLCIEVSDDGCGIETTLLEQLNSKDREQLRDHIGFYNVDTIISLYYGEQYGLHAKLLEPKGTKITITLPTKWEM